MKVIKNKPVCSNLFLANKLAYTIIHVEINNNKYKYMSHKNSD